MSVSSLRRASRDACVPVASSAGALGRGDRAGEADEAGAELLLEPLARDEEGGPAAIDRHEPRAVRKRQRRADGIDVVLPFAEGGAEAALLDGADRLLDAAAQPRPFGRMTAGDVVEEIVALALGKPGEEGAPHRRRGDGNARADIEAKREGVAAAAGLEIDHAEAVAAA